jgi:hypothetical protein
MSMAHRGRAETKGTAPRSTGSTVRGLDSYAGFDNPCRNGSSRVTTRSKKTGFITLFLTVSAVALFGVASLSSCTYKDHPSSDPTTPVLRLDVSRNVGFPPFMGLNTETGEVEGFEPDFVREIAKGGGFEVEFVTDTTSAVTGSVPFNARLTTLPGTHEYPGEGEFGYGPDNSVTFECDPSEPFYGDAVICVEKGNKALLDLVNKGIRALPPDTAERLEKKWGISKQ